MITSNTDRIRTLSIAAAAVLCTALFLPATTATADVLADRDAPPPVQVEPIDPNDPIIHSDGSISGGDGNLRGTDKCGSTASFPPFGSYGPESRATCAYFGSPGALAGYTWSVAPFSRSEACVSGLGYNAAKSPVFFGIGCGKSGARNVSWGNVAGYQRLKAYATGLLTGGMIAWH